jgi:hypothetical protein
MHVSEGGRTFPGKAAHGEGQRRIIVAAIALERFRARYGSYPATLSKLAPEFVKEEPIDFMDGKPLRYRLSDDGRYLLYSVGLDCVDDGGVRVDDPRPVADSYGNFMEKPVERDLVWPRVATESEIAAFRAEENAAHAEAERSEEERAAELHWSTTARLQLEVQQVESQPQPSARDPKMDGKPLSEILRSEHAAGEISMSELLRLKQIITGAEPEVVTFELPMRFDEFVKHGSIALCLDWLKAEDLDGPPEATVYDCKRGTNGNVLVTWSTIYEAPGRHALQAALYLNEPEMFDREPRPNGGIFGPVTSFTVTNLCQFAPNDETLRSGAGWTVRVRAVEPSANYRVRFISPKGEELKTVKGTTTNHLMVVDWDLVSESGRRWEGSFDSVFEITLPASGRAQVLKGP